MQPSRFALGMFPLITVLAGACADTCITPGYPAVRLSVREAATAAPVAVGPGELTYPADGAERLARVNAEPGAAPDAGELTICCVPRSVRSRLAVPGYALWDSTVSYRTRGRRDVPVPTRVAMRLPRRAGAAGARGRPVAQRGVAADVRRKSGSSKPHRPRST